MVQGKGGEMTKRVEMTSVDDWRHRLGQRQQRKRQWLALRQAGSGGSVGTGRMLFSPGDINIDILKIGVEGYDAQVLQGAKKTLQQHVKVVVFEVSNCGHWAETLLSEVVESMAVHDLVCYMTMADHLSLTSVCD